MDARGWDERYAGSDLVWGVEPNRFVVEEFAGLPPGRALDVACGEGRNAIWLAERGWQVTAVDFSSVGIDRGRQLAVARVADVDWVVADVVGYDPGLAVFDAVLIAYMHIDPADLEVVLRRAGAALAPGGRLVVVGHDLTNLERGIGGPQDPRILYTPEGIAGALPGLNVVRSERALRPVATPDGLRDAVDTVVTLLR